jgi:hypothetical protein
MCEKDTLAVEVVKCCPSTAAPYVFSIRCVCLQYNTALHAPQISGGSMSCRLAPLHVTPFIQEILVARLAPNPSSTTKSTQYCTVLYCTVNVHKKSSHADSRISWLKAPTFQGLRPWRLLTGTAGSPRKCH